MARLLLLRGQNWEERPGSFQSVVCSHTSRHLELELLRAVSKMLLPNRALKLAMILFPGWSPSDQNVHKAGQPKEVGQRTHGFIFKVGSKNTKIKTLPNL